MKLASKKKVTTLFGWIIKLWPFSGWGWSCRYCHSELVFSNGEWFSSRDINGTAFSVGPPHGDKPDWYDYIEIPMSKEEENRVMKWCERELFNEDGSKCKYDIVGVLLSFLPIPINWQNSNKWFCSEVCCAALQVGGWLAGYSAATISPLRLSKFLGQEINRRKYGKMSMFYRTGK
jgi:hypothetical protein